MGAFDIVLDDGQERRTVRLDRGYHGLYLPPMIWRELENFSSGAICMVLASRAYDEADYIRNFESFRAEKRRDREATSAAQRGTGDAPGRADASRADGAQAP
jgi:hypothetical protein